MNRKERQKISEKLVEIFKKRSTGGLELARKTMLAENIESKGISCALEYYTSNWQIFVHPGLFSVACEAAGGGAYKGVVIQAALSMLAAAFDIHDDIIDNSKIKQGKPTVFGKFGREIALLLGDAFLIQGFTMLGKSNTEIPTEQMRKIFETFEKSFFELGNAHALEAGLKGRIDIAPEEYMRILEMKAASAEADMRIGAIFGGGSNDVTEALAKYGKIVGMLATLRDEFVDVYEYKELSQRLKNEYLPLPFLYAFRNATTKKHICNMLSQKRLTKKDFEEISQIVLKTQETDQLKKYMERLAREAHNQLPILKESEAKLLLQKLLAALLEDLPVHNLDS